MTWYIKCIISTLLSIRDLQMHLIRLLKWKYKAYRRVSCLLSSISTRQFRTKNWPTFSRLIRGSVSWSLNCNCFDADSQETDPPKHLWPQQQPCSVPSVFQVVDHKRTPHGKIWFPCLRVQFRYKAIQIFLCLQVIASCHLKGWKHGR